MLYSGLQKVGRWDWYDLGLLSFSSFWGWGAVIFQLSGFYCVDSRAQIKDELYGDCMQCSTLDESPYRGSMFFWGSPVIRSVAHFERP